MEESPGDSIRRRRGAAEFGAEKSGLGIAGEMYGVKAEGRRSERWSWIRAGACHFSWHCALRPRPGSALRRRGRLCSLHRQYRHARLRRLL